MTYEAWRISYQSSEQAARAAYEECAQLRAHIEAAEKERDWNAERLEDAIEELTALRAKITEMEQQEPVARTMGEIRDWVSNGDGTYSLGGYLDAFMPLPDETSLYALPGAKGE